MTKYMHVEVMEGQIWCCYDWFAFAHEDFTDNMENFYGAYREHLGNIEGSSVGGLGSKVRISKSILRKAGRSFKIRKLRYWGKDLCLLCAPPRIVLIIAWLRTGVDICEPMFDGDPSDANYQRQLDYGQTLPFTNFNAGAQSVYN